MYKSFSASHFRMQKWWLWTTTNLDKVEKWNIIFIYFCCVVGVTIACENDGAFSTPSILAKRGVSEWLVAWVLLLWYGIMLLLFYSCCYAMYTRKLIVVALNYKNKQELHYKGFVIVPLKLMKIVYFYTLFRNLKRELYNKRENNTLSLYTCMHENEHSHSAMSGVEIAEIDNFKFHWIKVYFLLTHLQFHSSKISI